uniref:Uncharacterized protein n=1 Tax=Gallus gallus TaxID=9031 RepID=A0A8V1AB35_CHICK
IDSAGDPMLSSLRSSVEAKMQRTSWKVRKSSTVTACPVVVSLCSWKGRRGGEFSQEQWKVPQWVV